MKKLILAAFVIVTVSSMFLWHPHIVSAADPPFLKMDGPNPWSGISRPDLFDQLVAANPLYIFSKPFTESAIITPTQIAELHARLPQTKVTLHLLCCTMFNPEELDSSVAIVHAALQNTQVEFDDAWINHRKSFMKNKVGGYVYYKVEKVGSHWVNEGDGYLMDPASSFYQDFLYNKIKYHITISGFDGVYLDLMYPNFMRAFYYSIPMVNGNNITDEQWRNKLISLSRYLQNRKQSDPNLKMRNALIITNSVGGSPSNGSDPIDRIQFNRDLQTQGVQIENPFMNYRTLSTTAWLSTVNRIRDITALQDNYMKGWLNFHSPKWVGDQAECDRHGLYVYSSYLLGNQSPRFAFYFICKIASDNRQEPAQNLTHVRLGSTLNQYQQASSSLYLRKYKRGIVLVNPTAGQSTYRPDVNLKDAYSNTVYPKNIIITLPPYTGMVFLRDFSIPTPTPTPTATPQPSGCNQPCNDTIYPPITCQKGLICVPQSKLRGAPGLCRNPACPNQTSCQCPNQTHFRIKKFNDKNANKKQDAGELGLKWRFKYRTKASATAVWPVEWQTDYYTATTSAGLGPKITVNKGSLVQVTEYPKTGWVATMGVTKTTAALTDPAKVYIIGFGDRRICPAGKACFRILKFNDKNNNGTRDANEASTGKAWTFRYKIGEGGWNELETASKSGLSKLIAVAKGSQVTAEELTSRKNWQSTTGRIKTKTLKDAKTYWLGFGNKWIPPSPSPSASPDKASFRIKKFNDKDASKTQDAGELGLKWRFKYRTKASATAVWGSWQTDYYTATTSAGLGPKITVKKGSLVQVTEYPKTGWQATMGVTKTTAALTDPAKVYIIGFGNKRI